ncbi:MAG TPA: MFS transporter, partial [Ilumatobacteraceae bacterium]|nr:MFS transporter [Ilumatobacteraceae bacterium]
AVLGSRLATRIDARHETLAVLCGTAAMGLALGSIAAMPNLTGAVAVGTIGGLGSGIAFTPWFSLLQRATDDSERGTAFAIAETFEQMAFVVGMVVAGVAVGVLGPQLTYLLQAALLAVASLCAFRLVRGTRSD